ncbi:MAG: Ada metal-binding domain-containing protein [Myxococcota bacterium]|jgi:hypothetical protein|nr:Ada metal-binding domain-containing protein [Myxococcota bacterium]
MTESPFTNHRRYRLLGVDGKTYESYTPGTLGGHKGNRLYGRLDCPSALRYLAKGMYVKHRVFFADEATAIARGYRPCARCLPERYAEWRRGGTLGSAEYPWLVGPRTRPS